MKRFLIAGVLIGLLAVASLTGWLMSTAPLGHANQSYLINNGGGREIADDGYVYDGCCVNVVVRVSDIVVIRVNTSNDEEGDCHSD